MLTVGAQITLLRSGQRGTIDVPFSGDADYKSTVLEGVWPALPGARVTIVVGNCADQYVSVALDLAGKSKTVELPPHTTETIDGIEVAATGAAGWARIDTRGRVGAVRATGFVEVAGKPVGNIRFYDSDMARQSNLYATNVAVQGSEPLMALKNTTDRALTASISFIPFVDGEPFSLPPVVIAPRAAIAVPLGAVVRAAADRAELGLASVKIMNTGDPGSLIGSLWDARADGTLSTDVPLREAGVLRQATGSYPIRLDGDFNTVVTITNVTDEPADFLAHVSYAGGRCQMQPVTVAPGRTARFDMRALSAAHKLPEGIVGGQFRWSMIHGGSETRLNGRADISSVAESRGASYSCATCCEISFSYMAVNPSDLPTSPGNDSDPGDAEEYFHDSDGNDAGHYQVGPAWWDSDDSSIAWGWTDGGSAMGFTHGENTGETTVYANDTTQYDYYPDPMDGSTCDVTPVDPFAPVVTHRCNAPSQQIISVRSPATWAAAHCTRNTTGIPPRVDSRISRSASSANM